MRWVLLLVLTLAGNLGAQTRPTGLNVFTYYAGTLTPQGFRLTWTDPNVKDSFLIERQAGTGAFERRTVVLPGLRTWEDPGPFDPAQIYGYRVLSQAGVGYSEPTATVYGRIQPLPGSRGVGVGLSVDRPTICTQHVGFWSTHQRVLFRCDASNRWPVYYRPMPYPLPATFSP